MYVDQNLTNLTKGVLCELNSTRELLLLELNYSSYPACNSKGETDDTVVNTDCFSGYDPSIL